MTDSSQSLCVPTRSFATETNDNKKKNDTAWIASFQWMASISMDTIHSFRHAKNPQQQEQIQQAPWPATGGSSIWAVPHVAASALHHVLSHSFKDHRTEALGVSTPSTSARPECETWEAAPFFFFFFFRDICAVIILPLPDAVVKSGPRGST